jgi:hypothetical protein
MASKMSCKNSAKMSYTGKEVSPLGLGFCADAEKVGTLMKGRDGNSWIVGLKKGEKLWVRSKEPVVEEPKEETEEEKEETEEEKEETEEETEEEKPKQKTTKAKAPKKNPIDKVLETHKITGKAAEDIKALFEKKVKKSKEDKPKRAASAYNKFVAKRLPELRTETPGLQAKEYMGMAGVEWKALSDDDKKTYA